MSERRLYKHKVPVARQLRRAQTSSETLLWKALRGRQHGVRWRRQHPVFPWVLDFYCPEVSLAVEIDGGVHAIPNQRERDASRQESLEGLGIRFLRVSAEEVERDIEQILNRIDAAVASLKGVDRAGDSG